MPDPDEEQLIRRAQREPQAFLALYERYVDRIYRFAYSHTGNEALAKDVTSATFEKALRNIRRYQWRGVSFGAWLYRIAQNELTQQHRKGRFTTPLAETESSEADVERTVQHQEQHNALQTALAQLSATDQQVIALRFFEELSSTEVAEILQCSRPVLYLRLHRALTRLRNLLENTEINEEIPHATK